MTPFELKLTSGRWSGAQFPEEPTTGPALMALHGFSGAGLDFESLESELKKIVSGVSGHHDAPDLGLSLNNR